MPNIPTHNKPTTTTNRPTPGQLRYLRHLAQRTGTSFTYPRSFNQASREIDRLKAITTLGFTFAELDEENHARELHGDPPLNNATASRSDEVLGYGASATWNRRP